MFTLPIDQGLVLHLILIMTRVGSITVFAPFFSTPTFGVQPRIFFTLFVSLALLPALPLPAVPPSMPLAGLAVLFLQEAMIGLGVGLVMRMILGGVQLAGHLIGFQVGYSLVNVIDPQTAVQTATITVFLNFIAVVVFLILNGHHFIIMALAGSYTLIPPLSAQFGARAFDVLTSSAATVWLIGLQLAAPMLLLLVLLDVVVGIIGRVAPQIPILIVAFPLKVLVGILALGVGLTYFRDAIHHFLGVFESDTGAFLRALAHG